MGLAAGAGVDVAADGVGVEVDLGDEKLADDADEGCFVGRDEGTLGVSGDGLVHVVFVVALHLGSEGVARHARFGEGGEGLAQDIGDGCADGPEECPLFGSLLCEASEQAAEVTGSALHGRDEPAGDVDLDEVDPVPVAQSFGGHDDDFGEQRKEVADELAGHDDLVAPEQAEEVS